MKNLTIFRYTLAGTLFGAVFPVIATLLRIFEGKLTFTWESIVFVQKGDPLQWIIDTAPLFLGLFAWIGGVRQARVLQLNRKMSLQVEQLTNTTKELENLKRELEERVAERTLALETSMEVSRRLSTVLEVDRLLKAVVEQIQSAFGYYHVHIYLYDHAREYLVMAGGTGEAGKLLHQSGHKIQGGMGLVGRAAKNNQPILIPEVSKEPGWLPNVLLPDTRSEAALPIALGNNVLGVLDVQHNVVNGLGRSEVNLLQSIANQVAIALRNAEEFSRSKNRSDKEAFLSRISQKIQKAGSVEEVLKVAISELGPRLGTPRIGVELVSPMKTDIHKN